MTYFAVHEHYFSKFACVHGKTAYILQPANGFYYGFVELSAELS